MAFFISFEGGEGSGKTTQIEVLREKLQGAGFSVLAVQEPGTTILGRHIRDWLKRGPFEDREITELLLFTAARSELVASVIRPFIEADNNGIILSDRYADSTVVYQGFGRGIPIEKVNVVNDLAIQGIRPDLTLFLDCPPEVGLKRVGSFQLQMPLEQMTSEESPSRDKEGARFEEEPIEFHRRVRNGYLELAENEPERWRVLDGRRPKEELSEMIWDQVIESLSLMDKQHE